MTRKIAVLPGDGIGPEIVAEAVKVVDFLRTESGLALELEHALIGGGAYEQHGTPLPEATLALARDADADRKSTRLNSSHMSESRMPSSA